MKRTKEKEEQELESEENRAIYRDKISEAMRTQGYEMERLSLPSFNVYQVQLPWHNSLFRGRFATEQSYAKVENLVFGRMAFRGMNPEIERMLEAERIREEEEAASRQEAEVGDETMAAHFGSLRASVGKKFATKRQAAASELASASSSSTKVAEEGEDLLRRGAEMVEQMRGQHKVWRKEEAASSGRGRGRGAAGGKRGKFRKPPQD